jgi:hypothetical protein
MVELMASVKLNEWLAQNEIAECDFVSFVVNKSNESVYGAVFNTDKGLLFQQHKWRAVNKDKPLPRVSAEMQYSHKLVSDYIFISFRRIEPIEYTRIEVIDMQSA